jgi:hypothetical protein
MRIVFLAAVLLIAACDSQSPKTFVDANQIIRVADEAMHVTQQISAGASASNRSSSTRRYSNACRSRYAPRG